MKFLLVMNWANADYESDDLNTETSVVGFYNTTAEAMSAALADLEYLVSDYAIDFHDPEEEAEEYKEWIKDYLHPTKFEVYDEEFARVGADRIIVENIYYSDYWSDLINYHLIRVE